MKLHPIFARSLCSVAVLGSLSAAPSALAATLSLESVTQFTEVFGNPVDLTAEGTLDWAYWEETAGSVGTTVAPKNRKFGGSLIGSASAFGPDNGVLRGTGEGKTVGRYSFSDGTSTTSSSGREIAGLLFNNKIGAASDGDGFTLQITGNPESEQIVRLYLGGFAATGNLELTLAGAVSVLNSEIVFPSAGPKDIAIYTLRFQPDSIGDLLTVKFTASSPFVGNTSAHVGLEAVTVAVPEPGSALLLGIGAIGLLGVRRHRRA